MPDDSGVILLTDEELELLTPDELDAYTTYLRESAELWTLTPKQQLAEDLTFHADVVGYGGAAGGGKSDWLLWHAYHLCLRVPQSRCLLLRTVLPELRRTLIARSLQKFDHEKAHYRPGEKEWRFPNGSVIEFGFLDNDTDVYQYKSAEYEFIGIDEATEVTEFAFDYLRSRARTQIWKKRLGARPHIALCTNPGGVGHGWFKRRLVKATNHGENVVDVEVIDPMTDQVAGHRRTAFVPATLLDNPYIDPDYKLNLMLLPKAERDQLLYGSWDSAPGQFFDDWSHSLHVVKPFEVPPEWQRFRAIDYGYAAPFCCLWFAIDYDGNVWCYRELYLTGRTAKEQARLIIAASKLPNGRPEKIAYTVADPSIWARTGHGQPIATQYRQQGLACRRAMNARIDGWSRMREWLRPDPERALPGQGPQPQLRFFDTCEHSIETIPDLVRDPKKPEDINDGQEDHAADTVRYGAMSRPRRVQKPLRERMVTEMERRRRDDLRSLEGDAIPVHEVLGQMVS